MKCLEDRGMFQAPGIMQPGIPGIMQPPHGMQGAPAPGAPAAPPAPEPGAVRNSKYLFSIGLIILIDGKYRHISGILLAHYLDIFKLSAHNMDCV